MAVGKDRNERPQAEDERVGEPGDGGPGEAARFVGETAAELAQLARRHRFDVLAHLLDMAQMEADEIVRRGLMTELER